MSGQDEWRRAISEHRKEQRRGRTARRDRDAGRLGYRVEPPPAGPTSPGVVSLRLSGDPADIQALGVLLGTLGLEVIEHSGPRPNRYDPGVRVYVTVRVPRGDGPRSGG